ncbi:MAG: outer membrane protein assembly factor BamE [Candidatus Cloacimonetes bacterium]|nr:outer membrane protein assembly factor BamE [Candidatus Cloacimonadota bacterium]
MKIDLSYFKNVILICFLILIFTNSLSADQSSEIKKLEARIVELEKRVAKLEALLENSKTREIEFLEKWKNRSLWRKLNVGMTKHQVETLLGEPRKIDGGSTLTYWYYSKESWHSNISFDNSGSVYGWTEPD